MSRSVRKDPGERRRSAEIVSTLRERILSEPVTYDSEVITTNHLLMLRRAADAVVIALDGRELNPGEQALYYACQAVLRVIVNKKDYGG